MRNATLVGFLGPLVEIGIKSLEIKYGCLGTFVLSFLQMPLDVNVY